MKRFTELLAACVALLFHVALTAWLFCMAKLNNDFQTMSLSCLPLCGALLAAYFMDRLMLRKALPVPVFALAQLAFVALGAWLFTLCVYLEPHRGATVVLNCIIFCLGFLIAAYMAWMPGNENGLLMRFDALAVMLILLLVMDSVLWLPAAGTALSMCVLCLLLALCACVSMRSGKLAGRGRAVRGDPAAGRLLLALALLLLLGLAALIGAAATGGMKSLTAGFLKVFRAVKEAVLAVLRLLYGLLERFMLWLSQFASDAPMEPAGTMPGAVVDVDPSAQQAGEVPLWIYLLLAGLALAALAFLVFRLRHVRVGRLSAPIALPAAENRRSGLKKALLELLARIKAALLFRWRCLRWGKTAAGLLILCERRVEPGLERRSNESGQSFLRRIARCSYAPELSAALLELADSVERSFYSPVPAPVPARLCRSIRRGKFKREKTDVS